MINIFTNDARKSVCVNSYKYGEREVTSRKFNYENEAFINLLFSLAYYVD
jgi:hypothetical protein